MIIENTKIDCCWSFRLSLAKNPYHCYKGDKFCTDIILLSHNDRSQQYRTFNLILSGSCKRKGSVGYSLPKLNSLYVYSNITKAKRFNPRNISAWQANQSEDRDSVPPPSIFHWVPMCPNLCSKYILLQLAGCRIEEKYLMVRESILPKQKTCILEIIEKLT